MPTLKPVVSTVTVSVVGCPFACTVPEVLLSVIHVAFAVFACQFRSPFPVFVSVAGSDACFPISIVLKSSTGGVTASFD